MADYLKRYIHEDGQFKIAVVSLTGVGRDLFQTLSPSPGVLQLVTNAAGGAALLASNLKDQGIINIKFDGDGPLGSVTAEANTLGEVRSTAQIPDLVVEGPGGLFTRSLGNGKITVSQRTSKSDQVFRSVVSFVEGEMALNLANYLLQSEQVASGIKIGTKLDPEKGVAGAGGVLIQALPGANENLLFIIEDRLSTLPPVGDLFAGEDGHARVAEYLFDDMPVKWLETTEINYKCNCSRTRILQSLASLPVKDLAEMHGDGETLSLNCSFCTTGYAVTVEDLAAILELKAEAEKGD
ncbi:MAG: Hsp33 family molecular chaperone HslO [Acidobacteriota bacterium]|nr:Hsp33 family molecular chaperone HslO [Acidobacteriota bacterium]